MWLLLKQCRHACKDNEQKNHSLRYCCDLWDPTSPLASPLIESVVLILHSCGVCQQTIHITHRLAAGTLRGCCKFMLLILKRQVFAFLLPWWVCVRKRPITTAVCVHVQHKSCLTSRQPVCCISEFAWNCKRGQNFIIHGNTVLWY